MGSLVQRDDFGGWTRLTLNRPAALNALWADRIAAFSGKRG
jgi:enoyl-CoA hydratase/carnithine racemase